MTEVNTNKILKNFFKLLTALIIILTFVFILAPFITPILLGAILALAFSPFVGYFIEKGYSRNRSLVGLTTAIFFAGIAPVTILLIRGSKAINTLLSEQSLIETKQNIEMRVYAFLDNFSNLNNIDPLDVREKFQSFMTSLGNYVLKFFSQILSQVPNIILLSLITLLAFYFFLANEDKIRRLFDRYFYFSQVNGDRFIILLKSICKEVFVSNVLTGIIQAIVVAGGALVAGIGDVFVIFICTFFFSFIPVFGAGPFSFCIALVAFLEHKTGAGIVMGVVSIISGTADNFIRPYLAGRGVVKVHGFITFLAIIGGVLVLGLPGLFVGPLSALLAFGALPIISDDFFPEQNHDQ